MCTFLNKLPNRNKLSSVAQAKKQRLFLALKPTTDPKSFYRFRLLNFKSSTTDREYPFIERFTHTKWGKTPEGKPIIESQVICPATAFSKGLSQSSCPICKLANTNFHAYKESGKRDKESGKKGREYSRKFEALIPVWVVNDPCYESNNNKLKVFMFDYRHRKEYEQFIELINRESMTHNVFNSEDAVDFCIRFEKVQKVYNEGMPNEMRIDENEIKMMKFSNKPYTIEAITKELIDGFEFDEQYYITSTLDELNEYYNRYCKVQMDDVDIPEEEDVPVPPKPVHQKPVAQKKAMPEPLVSPSKVAADEPDELDSIIEKVSEEDELPKSKKKTPPPEDPEESASSTPDDDITLDELDDLDELIKDV